LEVFHDVEGDHAGGGEVGRFFEGAVFEPEDVEVDLVALDQVLVVEGFEALGLLALVAGRRTTLLSRFPLICGRA
jgi:hypothetical protein